MQVNGPVLYLDNKNTHHPSTRWKIVNQDGSPTPQMLGDSNKHAHAHARSRPSPHFADSTKSQKQLDLARAALHHTDNGYGGSLKTCSGRWISYSLLLWWASSVSRSADFYAFCQRMDLRGTGRYFLREISPSNMCWHVLLGTGISFSATA